MKRWFSYGAATIAALAVLFGALHAEHKTPAPSNTAWVADLTQRASAHNGTDIGPSGNQSSATSDGRPSGERNQTTKKPPTVHPTRGGQVSKKSSPAATQTSSGASLGHPAAETATRKTKSSEHKQVPLGTSSANLKHVIGGSVQPHAQYHFGTARHTVSSGNYTPSAGGNGGANETVASGSGASHNSNNVSTSPSDGNSVSATPVGGNNVVNDKQNLTESSGSSTTPATPPQNLGDFTIIVSEDNGKTEIADKHVPISAGTSLMQYMHQLFHIETSYGDDFMVSIEGIRSQWTGVPVSQRQPVDWFLYINGQQAPVGPADIYPKSGEVDVWDYHRWDPASGKG